MMTPQEACTAAAEFIGEHGHTQSGKFYERGVGYCAIGALAKVTGAESSQGLLEEPNAGMYIDWTGNPLFDQARELLRAKLGVEDDWAIPDWNDKKASTEEVILTLKRAGHG